MDEVQFLGYLILAVITLGGFIAIIMKFVQPINELRIVIQKLNDSIDSMRKDSERHDARLDNHGERLDRLETRAEKLETRMEMYHKEGPSK